jgi:predicted ABC-type ATPase
MDRPTLWLVAGPDGVGKTTYAFRHIRRVSGSVRFVNLDEIARGISPLEPEAGRIEAARIALRQIEGFLAEKPNGLDLRQSFTIETTLAGLTHLRTIAAARAAGWRVALLYFCVAHVEIALQRIARRVAEGGHHVPEADARRRFARSIANLSRYIAEIDEWRVFDNGPSLNPSVIAEGRRACRIGEVAPAELDPRLRSTLESLPVCSPIPDGARSR